MYLDFFKKYKIYVGVVFIIAVISLFSLFLFSEGDKKIAVQDKLTSEENMVYFDVNSQNALPSPVSDSDFVIDESELNADEFNKNMVEAFVPEASVEIIPQKPARKIAKKPYKPRAKHHARTIVKSERKSYKKYSPSVLEKITKPSHTLLSEKKFVEKQPCFLTKCMSLNLIKPVKVNYANAFEVADFINKNVPQSCGNLATAKGGSEIILSGSEQNILTAEKIIAVLDNHPKVAVYKLNYTKPFKMAHMLANSVFGGDCNVFAEGDANSCKKSPFTIYYNDSQNSVTVVGASSKQMDLVQEFVTFSDAKSPQACLDILLVEFNSKGVGQFQKLALFNGLNQNKDCNIFGKNLYCEVLGIIKRGGGKVLARPHLTVANDSNYRVNITSDYVHSRQGKYVYNIQDCGTKLKIHSLINSKNEVFLTLEPQYITVKRSIPNERNAKATLFNRRYFRYENIKLKDRQTLCLGGINSQQEYNFLGFKRTKNTELMMFVNVYDVQ